MPVIWKSNSQMLWEQDIIVWLGGGGRRKGFGCCGGVDGDKQNNLPVFSSPWWDCEGLGLWAELLYVFKTVYIQ